MDLTKLVFLLVLVCSIPVFHAYAQLDDKPPQGILQILFLPSKPSQRVAPGYQTLYRLELFFWDAQRHRLHPTACTSTLPYSPPAGIGL